jgi:L-fuconolactonase
MLVDAHHHLWDPARASYPWLTAELGPINRAFAFDELAPLLAAAGIDRTVLVQSADNHDDTDHMLQVADRHSEIGAVVAWLPLDRPAEAATRLEALQAHPAFRGVRCSINFEPDVEWLLRPDVGEGLALLEARGIPFDVVSVRRRHLELVPLLSERHPDLVMIIDHLSKPPIGRDDSWVRGWERNLRAAAANPNVLAKVSGLFPAGRELGDWTAEDLRPFVHVAVDAFGPERLMWGSDWPIVELAGGYARAWTELNVLFAELGAAERAAILGGTAARAYRIAAPEPG